MQLLVTGATGKVGVNLIERLLSDPRWRVARVRAPCHSRTITETDRVEVVKGSIEDRADRIGLRRRAPAHYPMSKMFHIQNHTRTIKRVRRVDHAD